MAPDDATTVFRFDCNHCHRPNTVRQIHRPAIHPYLVSTRCTTCGRINQFDGLPGTRLSEPAPGAAGAPLDDLIQSA